MSLRMGSWRKVEKNSFDGATVPERESTKDMVKRVRAEIKKTKKETRKWQSKQKKK